MSAINVEELFQVAKSAKEAVEAVRKAHTELDGRIGKIDEELKAGKVDAITKAAFQDAVTRVEKTEETVEKMAAEITELARKSANLLGVEQAKTLGQMAAESPEAKGFRGGKAELCVFNGPAFAKANVTSDPASAGALVQPHRADLLLAPEMPVTVRDVLLSVAIASNAVEYVREKLFTNNAGPQNGEGTAKPESGLTFEKATAAVETIAHWIPASRQILFDAPALRGVIDGKLRLGLKLEEDQQLLFGDGLNGNLLGLMPQAVAYAPTGIPANPTKIDHIRWSFLQVAKALYPATFTVLSLEDWATIQMQKTTDGAYIFGSPSDGAAPRLWGKRVIESHGMSANNFLTGSSLAATIWDREEVTVRLAEQHADFFIKNMVAILCEERLALTVERPQALVKGPFPAA